MRVIVNIEGDYVKVLVACEFSGIVRDAFIELGHDAVSCDILPSEKPGPHITGDVINWINDGWDLMIAHPPCTYLCNSGVRWLHAKGSRLPSKRWDKLNEAASFFVTLMEVNITKIAIENPIPHKYAVDRIGRRYDQLIHPWQFGHGETKATCLWLKGLPLLQPTDIVTGRKPKVHYEAPGPNRQRNRSRTYTGIAEAFADQWG